MPWCTAADVQALTGKVVEDSAVDMATGIIEMTGGMRQLTLPNVWLSDRNLDWLRRAVAYQAAFMVEYPDYFSRMDVSSFNQDGASANLKADALVLSPLARRCLRRLSWRGVRTINPSINRTADRANSRYSNSPDVPGAPAYTSSAFDDELPWSPL